MLPKSPDFGARELHGNPGLRRVRLRTMSDSNNHELSNPAPLQWQAVCVYASALLLCAAAAQLTGGASRPAPWPFIWMEAAIVQIVCTLPLAFWASSTAARHVKGPALAIVLAALIGVGWLLVATGTAPAGPLAGGRVTLAVWRLAAVLSLATALLLAAATLAQRGPRRNGLPALPSKLLPIWSLCVAAVAPALFVEAHIERDAHRLVELVEQSRLGSAAELARTLHTLDPQRSIDGYPLAAVADQLQLRVAELQDAVSRPLAVDAAPAERMARARDLAALGRDVEALETVSTLQDGPLAAEACNLAGVLYEDQQRWEAGLAAYQQARALAGAQADLEEQTLLLAEAARGVAYCERKQGRNQAAEAAYLELLALVPTAETHFLLAQFYEDTQQTSLAREHADRAAALAPAQFAGPVRSLKNRLSTAHFGCWGVQ